MTPRNLKYLRIDDDPPPTREDLVQKLPVEITELSEWYEFCKQCAASKSFPAEIMTIDFNFKEDTSGPWFPKIGMEDAAKYNAEFHNDPQLSLLRWPESLVEEYIGPNTGLIIGLHLISHAAFRDLPCGVGFRTYHPRMVLKDMVSAMMVVQIMIAAGVALPLDRLPDTLRSALQLIEEALKRPAVIAVLDALARFRQAFLLRAGVQTPGRIEPVRLWMESSSLRALLGIFQAATDERELDACLAQVGMEFYDRDGRIDSLDIRSLFLDRLYRPDTFGAMQIFPRLQISDVQPGDEGREPGVIWEFVQRLASRSPSNIGPVLHFFRKLRETGRPLASVNKIIKRPEHRLLAVIFAWLYEYGERWIASSRVSWDPFNDAFDGDFPPMTVQIGAFLRIADEAARNAGSEVDPNDGFISRSSLARLIRQRCGLGSLLTGPLRYNLPNAVEFRDRREAAIDLMIEIATRWHCLEEQHSAAGERLGNYRVISRRLPELRPVRITQKDLAQHLGLSDTPGSDPSNELKRIIKGAPGFNTYSVEDFLNMLEERVLPEHLKLLAWEFTDEFWGPGSGSNIPDEARPVCISDAPGAGTVPLTDWKRQLRQNQQTAVRMQSRIVRAAWEEQNGEINIWCRRRAAEEFGGDYYRIKRRGESAYRIYLADACGHGWPAALVVQELHGYIVALEPQALSPDLICAELDRGLRDDIGYVDGDPPLVDGGYASGRWATFLCLEVDMTSATLLYSNAGHISPVLIRGNGAVEELESQAGPVGLLWNSIYRGDQRRLGSGDRIILFTDGLAEGADAQKEMVDLALRHAALSGPQLGARIWEHFDAQSRASGDDATLILISCGESLLGTLHDGG